MKRKKSDRICPYCRGIFKAAEMTVDHVPPRGIFGELPLGTNLVTVRCCQECHCGTSQGDEALKALIGMGVLRSPEVASIREELDRALDLKPKWAKEMAGSIEAGQMKPVRLEDGQEAFAISIPQDARRMIFNSVRRTALAMFYKHDWKWDHRESRLRVMWMGDAHIEATRNLIRKFPPWPFVRRIAGERFVCAWNDFGEDRRYRFMLMIFYNAPAFWVIVEPLNDPHPDNPIEAVFGPYVE